MKKILSIFIIYLSSGLEAQCWTSIDAGYYFSVGIKTDGTLWTCGYNNYGQLGDGTNISRNIPTQVGTVSTWKTISAGTRDHVLALKQDGTMWGWGRNDIGQLGDGTNIDKTTPVQIGSDNDWLAIAAGGYFSLALKQNGTLWAWGSNAGGSLGDGTNINKNTPIQVGTASDWKRISAGLGHCLAIKTDGSLWSWGENNNGPLGIGNTLNKNSPQHVGNATDWLDVEAGMATSFGIKQSGLLFAWGHNFDGNLGSVGSGSGSGEFFPIQIGTGTWKSISSLGHTLGIKTDGTLWGWGKNMAPNYSIIPVQLSQNTDWIGVAAGLAHGLALKIDGSFWSWGANGNGQLGDGSNSSINAPTNTNCITTNIPDRDFQSVRLLLFPNPASTELNVNLDVRDNLQIEVLNPLGKLIIVREEEVNKINIQDLAPGAYLLKVRWKGEFYFETFVKISE